MFQFIGVLRSIICFSFLSTPSFHAIGHRQNPFSCSDHFTPPGAASTTTQTPHIQWERTTEWWYGNEKNGEGEWCASYNRKFCNTLIVSIVREFSLFFSSFNSPERTKCDHVVLLYSVFPLSLKNLSE